MIVRIATEGQYRLSDDLQSRVNELDNAAVAAVDSGDEGRFQSTFDELVNLVRSEGQPVGEDDLVESDVIIPPPDLTFEEAKTEFVGEGLLPD